MKIENIKVYDMEESIRASKFPMAVDVDVLDGDITNTTRKLGTSGMGEGHDQFLTGIRVAFDLTCTNKMWVEVERYRFIEFVSSQSTMHRITKFDIGSQCNGYVLLSTVETLNKLVEVYNGMEDKSTEKAKELYLTILYNVPSGFELTARLTTNYRALKTYYNQRHNHRLPEQREFCKELEKLPKFMELCIDK